MPLDTTTKPEPRARATVWRSKEGVITLYLRGLNLTCDIGLTPEEAMQIAAELQEHAAQGPRVGTAADLGYEEAA